MELESFESVFLGKIIKEEYRIVSTHRSALIGILEPYIEKNHNNFEHKEFFRCVLNKPMLESGELLYISELGIHIKIEERMRSTTGEIVYFTNHVIEVIESEETRRLLEEELDKEMDKYYRYLEEEQNKNKKKKWWFQ